MGRKSSAVVRISATSRGFNRPAAARAERLPSVMDTIDIQSLVIAKIDSLDARRIEQLLLTVMSRHLKWIKLFGAVIGAVIGLLLIALRAVSPGL